MTTMVVCPQCNRPAEIAPGEHPFCSYCDYPLFWVAPRGRAILEPEREPQPLGPVCVVCRTTNEVNRGLCQKCGQPLAPVMPRRRRSWEAATPVVKPVSRYRRLLIGMALGALCVALLAAMLWAAWYFLWPRSEWQSIVLDQGEASWDIAATVERGSPIISYVDASDFTLRIVVCGNPFCDSAVSPNLYTTIGVIGNLGQGAGSAVAVGADGRPIVAYRNADRRALTIAHCGDTTCRDPGAITITELDPGAETSDPTLNVGFDPSIAIGADGFPIIAYHDVGRGALKIAHCEDRACSRATIVVLDRSATDSEETSGVGADTSIRIDGNGLPIIAFRDDDEKALKIARCSDARCTQAVINTMVAQAGRDPGHDAALVLAPDGTPMVAYADWSDDGVYLAKCAEITCGTVSVRRLDRPEDGTSGDTSLLLNRDGLPVVAFRQREPGDERARRILKVVRCRDLLCERASAPEVVDGQGRTGYSPRLLLLQDGTVTLAYGDATQGSLEYGIYR